MAGPRNGLGFNDTTECYRTFGAAKFVGWCAGMSKQRIAAYRAARVRCRRFGDEVFVREQMQRKQPVSTASWPKLLSEENPLETPEHIPTPEEEWLDYCRGGSCFVTVVEVEFQHIVHAASAPDDLSKRSSFPSHAVEIAIDSRSNCLLLLDDGTPAHARWSSTDETFRRVGDDQVIPSERVRAWAALPYPIADA